MKRALLVIGLILTVAVLNGCHPHKNTPPPIEQKTPEVVPTPAPTPPPQQEQPVVETPAPPEVKEADFQTVYFDFDKYNVRNDQKSALESNAAILKNNPTVKIKIEGHCDERGTVEYNLALGDRRANAVKKYLGELGIALDRIEVISYGKERPAVMGTGEGVWSKNRRAEFRIVTQ